MNIFFAILVPCVDLKKILLEVLIENSRKLFFSQKIRKFYENCKDPPYKCRKEIFLKENIIDPEM